MAYDLISIPDEASDKIWFKAHKAQRKLDDKKWQADHKEKVKAERIASKAALKQQKQTLADVKEDE